MSLSAVVLAAGEGTRMRSGLAKVLHQAAGRALLDHVLEALAPLAPTPLVVVVGHGRDQVTDHLAGRPVLHVVQEPPRGTGDAVRCALERLPRTGEVLVLSGDVPLLTTTTLEGLVAVRRTTGATAVLASAVLPEGGAYGRVIRSEPGGPVTAIVEARDATPKQLAVREVNSGTYLFDLGALRGALAALTADNAQGEYYLTDVVAILAAEGRTVLAEVLTDPVEMTGVNTRSELAAVHALLNRRVIVGLQRDGVTVLDPASIWVDADCRVGRDTVLEPGVHLRRGCVIGERCRIGAHSVLEGVSLAAEEVVPPLQHLCPG
jgi:bifunctional UDP-N-acetylglucosamine pyrophosphorylase / glucosamine-1-phosphate N-acetyltransferase